jgi:hypothetical protein
MMKTKTFTQSTGAGANNLQPVTNPESFRGCNLQRSGTATVQAGLAASESFVAHLKRRHPRISWCPSRNASFRRLCRSRAQGYAIADALSFRSQRIAHENAIENPPSFETAGAAANNLQLSTCNAPQSGALPSSISYPQSSY